MPGGVNSPVRAFGGVDRPPLWIARAKGSKIFDIDGNEYIDYVGSWGPMILGHAHPAVLAAVHQAADKGTSFGTRHGPRRSWRPVLPARSDPSRNCGCCAAVLRR